MAKLTRLIREIVEIARDGLIAKFVRKPGDTFDDLRMFCLFIGYPRSGHSLVGALLDAHPNAIISHELDVLKYLQYPVFRPWFTRPVLYQLIVDNSRFYSRRKRQWDKFVYEVPGQYQGTFTELTVIGDKKGGGTTERVMRDPTLIDHLRARITENLRILHVVRNPFDNISTMAKRSGLPLDRAISWYFDLARTNQTLSVGLSDESLLTLRHEDLIGTPRSVIKVMCEFLDLDVTEDYLENCSEVIYSSPHKSRYDANWNQELISAVQDRIGEFSFLAGYEFDS